MGCGSSKAAPPPPKMFAFRIKVLGGLNLYNNEFGIQAPGSATSKFKFQCKPNSYVEIKCEGQTHSTRIIRWEVNPVWNEEFIFTCDTRKPLLKLKVYDQVVASDVGKKVSGQGAIIGESDVNLHGLLTKDEREMWVQLKGSRGKGELGVIVQECYRTEVEVVAGHDLVTSDKFTKTSDVYMTVQVGQQEKGQTAVKHWTTNPRWTGEKFFFYIPYKPIECHLQCMLWDKDMVGPDESMGWVHHNLNHKGAQYDKETKQLKAETIKLKVRNNGETKGPAGEIELVVGCEGQYVPDCPDPGPVPEAQKAEWPPCAPQTCTFEVKALGAFNLAAADPNVVKNAVDDATNELFYQQYKPPSESSDPFLRCQVEDQIYDTSKIPKTIHPEWNETLRFVCRNKSEALMKFTVFDHDMLSENDRLGAATLPASLLRSGERVEVWSVLDFGARGEIGVALTQAYQIKVRVGACHDFPAMDFNGMSDPFLKIAIEDQWHQTRVVTNDRNPIFDEDFRWAVTRIGPDVMLKIEAYDSDLALFNRQVAPDFIGSGEIALDQLERGVPNKLVINLKNKKGEAAGTVNVTVLDEMPLPPSVLSQLSNMGRDAIGAASAKAAAQSKAFFKIVSPEDPDNNKEAQVEPEDPKTQQRPRFCKFRCTVLGLRGFKGEIGTNVYVAVCVPSQGFVVKTQPNAEKNNADFNEEFEFDVPTRTNGGFQFFVMDTSQVPFANDWNMAEDSAKAAATVNVPFRSLNKDEGSIRGSKTNDLWLPLECGGELVVRIEEDFRFQVELQTLEAKETPNATKDTDVPITMTLGEQPLKCHTAVIQKNERLVAIHESHTVFTRSKNNLDLTVDAGPLGKGSFNLQPLKRGIAKEVTIELEGGSGGTVKLLLKEEEKMGLVDQLVDIAANAAKLAGKALSDAKDYVASGKAAEDAEKKAEELKESIQSGEAAEKAKEAVGDAAKAIGGAIGGMFGKKD